MRLLLTGGTGFIGSHLIHRLTELGHAVSVIVRPDSNLAPLQGTLSYLAVYPYDGSIESLITAAKEARPDVVLHLASLFITEHTSAQISPLVASNILFGTQLAEAMRQTGLTRLVNTGTSWQHYRDADYNPVCLYAATKEALETLLRYYVEAEGLSVVNLHLFDTYGPGDHRPKLINLLRRLVGSDQALAMSAGDQRIDLVYIDDVVSAFVTAIERLDSNVGDQWERFGVSSRQPLSLREVVAAFEAACGRPLPILWGERSYRRREVMTPWTRDAWLPGWEPEVSFSEGLRRTLADHV